jgi:predicted nucleotidyltransferase/uncharacterized protein (UPF0332 family)
MAKDKKEKKKQEETEESQKPAEEQKPLDGQLNIPPEIKEKLEQIKEKLDKFSKNVLEKFEEYIIGVGLLPPKKEDTEKKDINVIVLVDDTDSTKMSKEELKTKLAAIIEDIGQKVDKNIKTETVILSEIWQSCMDAKYDVLRMVAVAAPIYDKGMMSAIKVAELHKEMVVKKFEKYIVSYVLAGSLVQGRATKDSDIDVFIVVDDTDVKKMTRAELKDKLRAIIIGMGIEAGSMTNVKNKLNIQVYILTDFWENIKEANPIIFTFLRDGIPFYDRGIFMPWKQLLRMGRIKPSPEAIDQFMESGDRLLERVHLKLNEIGMEDMFWATLTPSQAALMLYGIPPPTPRETPELMKEVFVDKEKMLEEKYINILKKNIEVRKELEHGKIKTVSGADVDKMLADSEDYLKRIKRLFTQIEKVKEEQSVVEMHETISTVIRDVLKLENVIHVKNEELLSTFTSELINKGKIPQKYLRVVQDIFEAKKSYDEGKITKTEIENARKQSRELLRVLIEHMQRKRGYELERTKIRVKHGSKFGEVMLLGNVAFIIMDLDQEQKEITKAELRPDGSLGPVDKCTLEEMEQAIAKIDVPEKAFIKAPIFDDLKKIFGKDVEILVKY